MIFTSEQWKKIQDDYPKSWEKLGQWVGSDNYKYPPHDKDMPLYLTSEGTIDWDYDITGHDYVTIYVPFPVDHLVYFFSDQKVYIGIWPVYDEYGLLGIQGWRGAVNGDDLRYKDDKEGDRFKCLTAAVLKSFELLEKQLK